MPGMRVMKSSLIKPVLLAVVLILVAAEAAAVEISVHKNKISGLLTWTADDEGFKIELIQLLPDFVRAIYAKHNLIFQQKKLNVLLHIAFLARS